MIPFEYPSAPLVRRHGPVGYLDYSSFRPWLRDEFGFRCVYCLRREQWEPNLSVFEAANSRRRTEPAEWWQATRISTFQQIPHPDRSTGA